MSSKSTEPRSIASQLVFLFAPAAAFLLCCGLGVLYWIVVRHAYAEDRAFLSDKVLAIRTDLNSQADLEISIMNCERCRGESGRPTGYECLILSGAVWPRRRE
jgi:hypothetical protein